MKRFLISLFLLIFITLIASSPQKVMAAVTLVYEFAGGGNSGSRPCEGECKLVLDNGVFYGVTEMGGDSNQGTIFKINVDGSGFTLLREFAGGVNDGGQPKSGLIIDGSVLYGMTLAGGDSDYGTIFKINTDGTGFTLLHEFDLTNGGNPYGVLVKSGTVLYGMANDGGSFQDGVIFKINTDGTGYSVLHEFEEGADDVGSPQGSLILSGSTLYGMASAGGSSLQGGIFKINTDGTGYTVLREFTGSASDGGLPYGSLLMYQSKLYGLTNEGGDGDFGTIFQINTDGTGFTLLREFTGGTTDGQWPGGSLIENNGVFYGMTYYGGDNDFGTIFQIDADGTDYSVLHEFLGGVNDGKYSNGTLLFNTSNSRLYGMTVYGGDSDVGTIFYNQTAVPTPSPTNTPTPTPSPTSAPSPTNTPTPSPNTTQTNSSSSNSNPSPTAQILPNLGGIFNPVGDSQAGGQKVIVQTQPGTFNFYAFVSSIYANPVNFKSSQNGNTNPSFVLAGNSIGLINSGSISWQIGKIQEIWYKAYAPGYQTDNAAKIIPQLQNKTSIITLAYTNDNLIPAGNPRNAFNPNNLKMAYSIDGRNWKIIPESVVDPRNKTVSVVGKVGGYYVIVASNTAFVPNNIYTNNKDLSRSTKPVDAKKSQKSEVSKKVIQVEKKSSNLWGKIASIFN